MSVIEASFVKVAGTLADGTLRIVFDVEPRHAKDAFAMFNMPGTMAALAALLPDHIADAGKMVDVVVDKPRGGALSKLAGMWCDDEKFRNWLELDPSNAAPNERGAALCIYDLCGIGSRAELDHNPVSAEKFHRLIRIPYTEYMGGK